MAPPPKDHLNGMAYEIAHSLGELTAGVRQFRSDIFLINNRQDHAERRMDFLSEENIRRQAEILAAVAAIPKDRESASTGYRMGSAVLEFILDLIGDKKDIAKWLILLILAWATNAFHLPPAWRETAQHALAQPSDGQPTR